MKKSVLNFMRIILAAGFVMLFSVASDAQYLRTSYFMEGTPFRLQLNPAFAPTKGYFNLPVIGQFNVEASSNSLGAQDIIDITKNSSDFYMKQDFMDRLTDENRINLSMKSDILSFGWFRGKGFWSFNVGLRADVGASIRKSFFQFLNTTQADGFEWNNSNFDIASQSMNTNVYTEIGLGYSHPIGDRLTIGGRFKFLLGVGNVKLDINNITIDAKLPNEAQIKSGTILPADMAKYHAKLNVTATMETAMKGMEIQEGGRTATGGNYIDKIKMNGFGVAGYGTAFDLGASFKITNKLIVSASVLDLGSIKWAKNSSNSATASPSVDIQGSKYEQTYAGAQQFSQDVQDQFYNRTSSGDILDYDMLQMKKGEGQSHSTSLNSSIVLGAEYAVTPSLSVGVVSTTRNVKPKSQSELTFCGTFRPKNWLNIALSYSTIVSKGKSFGVAVKLGPLFVGTDYMFLGNNSQAANAFVGFSIPLGGRSAD